jgi:hypothetical protein
VRDAAEDLGGEDVVGEERDRPGLVSGEAPLDRIGEGPGVVFPGDQAICFLGKMSRQARVFLHSPGGVSLRDASLASS